MGDIVKKNNTMPIVPTTKPDKVETYGGKQTARVTKIFKQSDGSTAVSYTHLTLPTILLV